MRTVFKIFIYLHLFVTFISMYVIGIEIVDRLFEGVELGMVGTFVIYYGFGGFMGYVIAIIIEKVNTWIE